MRMLVLKVEPDALTPGPRTRAASSEVLAEESSALVYSRPCQHLDLPEGRGLRSSPSLCD